MEMEHNNCSPSLAFRTNCLLRHHSRDCLCLLPTTVCIVYWMFWVEERDFAEGIFIILHPFNHANCTSYRKLRWDKINSMSVLSALSSLCISPSPPTSPPALHCQS